MTECSEILAVLSAYQDRDLDAATCALVDQHLAGCAACSTAAVSLKRMVTLCKEFRSQERPGPMAEPKRQEMKDALRRALAEMRQP
jgi:RNA polymerase sigma-70 factor (ECF subfamily)